MRENLGSPLHRASQNLKDDEGQTYFIGQDTGMLIYPGSGYDHAYATREREDRWKLNEIPYSKKSDGKSNNRVGIAARQVYGTKLAPKPHIHDPTGSVRIKAMQNSKEYKKALARVGQSDGKQVPNADVTKKRQAKQDRELVRQVLGFKHYMQDMERFDIKIFLHS